MTNAAMANSIPRVRPLRVDHAEDVMRDEAVIIPSRARSAQKHVLEDGERTDPPADLDERSPDRRREMNPLQRRPAQHEKSARDDEDDEREVDDRDGGGEGLVEHRLLVA